MGKHILLWFSLVNFDMFCVLLVDINECDNGKNDCHGNAKCSNVPGSYTCQCKEGFVGDGRRCDGTYLNVP